MASAVSQNVDVGPAKLTYESTEIGETNGETTFNYDVETSEIRTEESGLVDEVVTDEMIEVTIPILETDVQSLGDVFPYLTVVEDGTSGDKKLTVGSLIGERLSNHAGELVIHPQSKDDTDLSKDINIWLAYPVPGPLEFSYSRDGQRVANVTFRALKDDSQSDGEEFFVIGDPSITAA